MKKIFLILCIPLLIYAKYDIIYRGDKIAELDSIKDIYKGYMIGKLNFKAKFATGLKYIVFYEEGFKPNINKAKYKEDKAGIITVGRMIDSFKLRKPIVIDSPKQYLSVKCKYKSKNNFVCKFARQDKEDFMIYRGEIIVKNGELEKICENRTNICLIRKK